MLRKALATLAKQENTWRGALSRESLENCISGFRGGRAKGTLRRLNGLLENEEKQIPRFARNDNLKRYAEVL